jgi:hypothetical protein
MQLMVVRMLVLIEVDETESTWKRTLARRRKRQCILLEPGVTGEVRFVNKLFDLAA